MCEVIHINLYIILQTSGNGSLLNMVVKFVSNIFELLHFLMKEKARENRKQGHHTVIPGLFQPDI